MKKVEEMKNVFRAVLSTGNKVKESSGAEQGNAWPVDRIGRTLATGVMLSTLCFGAHAQSADDVSQTSQISEDKNNVNVAPVLIDEAKRSGRTADEMSSRVGKTLDGLGIYPSVILMENAFDSGTLGIAPGKVQLVSTIGLGLDLDLTKLAGIDGGAFHFSYLRNYSRINNPVTPSMGVFPLGFVPPNAPRSDVPVFTYEQHLLDHKLDIEVGRKQFISYFVDEYALWEDLSSTYGYAFLTLAPPYGLWMGRVRYEFGGGLYAQAAVYEFNNNLWGRSGWDWSTSGDTGVTFLETLGYHRGYRDTPYPWHAELTSYTNTARQNDPYYTNNGTSSVFDKTSSVQTHYGASGFILRGGRVFYRADGGESAHGEDVSALYAFGSIGVNPQSWAPSGVAYDAYAGVAWLNPFGLANDVLGVKVEADRLTSREQKFLSDANLSVGGGGYRSPRTTEFAQVYSHFIFGKWASVDPFVAYGVGANTVFDPYTTLRPKNGYVLGCFLIINLGNLVGLPSRPRPWEG
jgi:carbohydrate-selective porin OprB